jgi:hypothetical protein
MKSAWVRTLPDTAGEFIWDSESVPRAVASVALAKDLPRKPRSLPLAVLIRQQNLEACVPRRFLGDRDVKQHKDETALAAT